MEQKRTRGLQFSSEECVLLLDLVLKYEDIVENKSKRAIILNEKKNAWRNITVEYNTSALRKRSLKTLKIKYEKIKMFLKKKCVHHEKHNSESDSEQLPLCAAGEKVSSIYSLPVQDDINVNENGDIEAEEVRDNFFRNVNSEIPEFGREPIILDTNQEVASFNSEFRQRPVNTSAETEQILDVDADLVYKPMNDNCYTLKQKLYSLQIKSLQYDLNMRQMDRKLNELQIKLLKVDLQRKKEELKIKERQLKQKSNMFHLC